MLRLYHENAKVVSLHYGSFEVLRLNYSPLLISALKTKINLRVYLHVKFCFTPNREYGSVNYVGCKNRTFRMINTMWIKPKVLYFN